MDKEAFEALMLQLKLQTEAQATKDDVIRQQQAQMQTLIQQVQDLQANVGNAGDGGGQPNNQQQQNQPRRNAAEILQEKQQSVFFFSTEAYQDMAS